MIQAYILFKTRPFVLVLIAALVMWSFGLPSWIGKADAAAVTTISDLLSTSEPGADATHSITFTTPNGLTAGQTVRITFDPDGHAFNLTGLTNGDVASSTTHTVHTSSGSCGAGVDFFVNAINIGTPDYVEYALCSGDTVASSTTINFRIGYTGSNDINNPTTIGSYIIRIGGTMPDSGDTRVAIVDEVTVTAEVQTIFDFTVTGVNASTTVGTSTVTFATTTATSMNFGVLSPGTAKTLAQELRVNTNALNGFTVTVRADQTLTAGNGADIDTFIDGGNTVTATAWTVPSNNFGSEDTYGHWGISSSDPTPAQTSPRNFVVGGPNYVGDFVITSVPVFYHGTAASYSVSAVNGQSFARVIYRAEIGTLQEAANDYTATLTYVATPVF